MDSTKKYRKWLGENTAALAGKRVAITGSTGGLGKQLCTYLASLGATLVLVDRNRKKSETLRDALLERFSEAKIECVSCDLEDMATVRSATETLLGMDIDVFVHNAGAYAIERKICDTGYDNVFQINFVSAYYMIKKLALGIRERGGKIVVVGSIAHNYSHIDKNSIDYKDRNRASLVYGNAKRHLMFSLYKLFEETPETLSIVHPGITFTGITAHYPPLIYALIKHPMKVVFMNPSKAALSLLSGVFENLGYCEWIGPRVFDVWGMPRKKKLKTAKEEEIQEIFDRAEKIYREIDGV